MPMIRREVGHQLIIWSMARSGQGSRRLFISAHGAESKVNKMADAPACTLHFYGPHGHVLGDSSMVQMTSGMMAVVETKKSKESHDYSLSKYQNSEGKGQNHNDGRETYKTLEALDKDYAFSAETMLARYPESAALVSRGVEVDILTIRNRNFFASDVLLSWVLRELKKEKFQYDDVHCSFCRGSGTLYRPQKAILSAAAS